MLWKYLGFTTILVVGATTAQANGVIGQVLADQNQILPGGSFTIGMEWSGNTRVAGADYELHFNTNLITLNHVDFDDRIDFGSATQQDDDLIFVTWAILAEEDDDALLGQDSWLTFTASSSLNPGDTIQITPWVFQDNVRDYDARTITHTVSGTSIHIIPEPGSLLLFGTAGLILLMRPRHLMQR